MTGIANISQSEYYAAIFTSELQNDEGYEMAAGMMLKMAAKQPGFLGVETSRGADGVGITVSYWDSMEAIGKWKQAGEHMEAQSQGMNKWYKNFRIRICKVEREYGSDKGV